MACLYARIRSARLVVLGAGLFRAFRVGGGIGWSIRVVWMICWTRVTRRRRSRTRMQRSGRNVRGFFHHRCLCSVHVIVTDIPIPPLQTKRPKTQWYSAMVSSVSIHSRSDLLLHQWKSHTGAGSKRYSRRVEWRY